MYLLEVEEMAYNIWTMTLSSLLTATEAANVAVTQNNGYEIWTITLSTPITMTKDKDVVVTQATTATATGTLEVALTGSAVSTVTVRSAIGQVFDQSADLVIKGTAIASSTMSPGGASKVTTAHASGTLAIALTNSAVLTVTISADFGQMFDTTTDLTIGGGGGGVIPTIVALGMGSVATSVSHSLGYRVPATLQNSELSSTNSLFDLSDCD